MRKATFRITALLALSMATRIEGAEPTSPVITRFLSPHGDPLPDDYLPNLHAPVFFIIHGFQASGTDVTWLNLAAAVRDRFPDANVVIVDWHLSQSPQTQESKGVWQILDIALQYQQSVKAARDVAIDIVGWMKHKGIGPRTTVLCGHSLGAQIAAFVSQECRDKGCGQCVRAILAADPAGPFFTGQAPENRLDPADADEVIVIHTTECFGDYSIVGTLDIYVPRSPSSLPDDILRHSDARELLAESFRRTDMRASDGTPFGANALGLHINAKAPLQYPADNHSRHNNARRDYCSLGQD